MRTSDQDSHGGEDIARACAFFDRLKRDKPKLKGMQESASVARRFHRLVDELDRRIDRRGWRTELIRVIDKDATSSKRLREFTLPDDDDSSARREQLRRGAYDYARLAVRAASLAGEPNPELRLLSLFEGTSLDPARPSRAPALDAFDPIRELQLLIEATVATIIKRRNLDGYFASLSRHTGRWGPVTKTFRSSQEPILLGWRCFDHAFLAIEEVPPLPSVPLLCVPLVTWDDTLRIDDQTPVDDIDAVAVPYSLSGSGHAVRQGRLTLFSEVRLAIGPTTSAATIGPLFEHRVRADFVSVDGDVALVTPYGLFDKIASPGERSGHPLIVRLKGTLCRAELDSVDHGREGPAAEFDGSRHVEFFALHEHPAADVDPEGEPWWNVLARVVEPYYFHWSQFAYGRLWQMCQVDVSLAEEGSLSEHCPAFQAPLPAGTDQRQASLMPRRLAGSWLEESVLTDSLLEALDGECRLLCDQLNDYLAAATSSIAGRYGDYRARLRKYGSDAGEGGAS